MRPPDHAPRILAGSLKGRALAVPEGRGTRPLRVLARRSLFDRLAGRCDGAAFLDLFAGAGSVGFEAASRGARRVVLVESARAALRALRQSAATLGVEDRVEIVGMEALDYATACAEAFDLVYLGPPYPLFEGQERADLDLLLARAHALLAPGGLLIVESPTRLAPPEVPGLALVDRRTYGESVLGTFERASI